MVDYTHYDYRVFWSEEDHEYVGRCAEFPSLSWLSGSQTGALEGITRLVADCAVDMESNGEKIPVPISDRIYSGKFVFRTTPQRHRELVRRAAEASLSLNGYINERIPQMLQEAQPTHNAARARRSAKKP